MTCLGCVLILQTVEFINHVANKTICYACWSKHQSQGSSLFVDCRGTAVAASGAVSMPQVDNISLFVCVAGSEDTVARLRHLVEDEEK